MPGVRGNGTMIYEVPPARREGPGQQGDARAQSNSAAVSAGSAVSNPPRKRARGGGGAWRAYVAEQWRANRRDGKQIAESYHALEPDSQKIAELRREGAAGSEKRSQGLAAFGPTQRSLAAARLQSRALAFLRQHPNTDVSFLEDSSTTLTVAMQGTRRRRWRTSSAW